LCSRRQRRNQAILIVLFSAMNELIGEYIPTR
jgi:hypothetical protein